MSKGKPKRKRSALVTGFLFTIVGVWTLVRGFVSNSPDTLVVSIMAFGFTLEELARGKWLEW